MATAYLGLMVGVMRRSAAAVGLSAAFAYVKLTALPFLMVGLGVGLAAQRDQGSRVGIRMVLVFAAILALLFLPYFHEGVTFLYGALRQEYFGSPTDLSMLHVSPRFVVKSAPFILLATGVLLARWWWEDLAAGFPFFLGAAIILTLYPMKAFDYSVRSLLGLIPLVGRWARLLVNQGHWQVPVMAWGYVTFVVVTSLFGTKTLDRVLADHMIFVYLALGALFIVVSLIRPAQFTQNVS